MIHILIHFLDYDDDLDKSFKPIPSDTSLDTTQDNPFKDYSGTTLLVYYDQLKILLRRCPRCGKQTLPDKIHERNGSQFRIDLKCLEGCSVTWTSQPVPTSLKGIGNLDLTTSIFFAGKPFHN